MSRSLNIFHLVLILVAFVNISDASRKRPDGYLVRTKVGKNYLAQGVANKDKDESPEILNRQYRPGYGCPYGGCTTTTTTTWTTTTTTWTTRRTTTTEEPTTTTEEPTTTTEEPTTTTEEPTTTTEEPITTWTTEEPITTWTTEATTTPTTRWTTETTTQGYGGYERTTPSWRHREGVPEPSYDDEEPDWEGDE